MNFNNTSPLSELTHTHRLAFLFLFPYKLGKISFKQGDFPPASMVSLNVFISLFLPNHKISWGASCFFFVLFCFFVLLVFSRPAYTYNVVNSPSLCWLKILKTNRSLGWGYPFYYEKRSIIVHVSLKSK